MAPCPGICWHLESRRTLVLAECPGKIEMPVPEMEQISELCTVCVGLEVPLGHPRKDVE